MISSFGNHRNESKKHTQADPNMPCALITATCNARTHLADALKLNAAVLMTHHLYGFVNFVSLDEFHRVRWGRCHVHKLVGTIAVKAMWVSWAGVGEIAVGEMWVIWVWLQPQAHCGEGDSCKRSDRELCDSCNRRGRRLGEGASAETIKSCHTITATFNQ
jgi:hypothetical protein